MNKKTCIFPVSILLLPLIMLFLSCAANKPKEDKTLSPSDGVTHVSPEEFEKRYMKEGFISERVFRIIILSPLEECQSDIESVRDKARKRAISTLQKYLVSENRIIDQRSTAEIINIVNANGSLVKKDIQCQNNQVFFYDIERENLQRYLHSISKSRE